MTDMTDNTTQLPLIDSVTHFSDTILNYVSPTEFGHLKGHVCCQGWYETGDTDEVTAYVRAVSVLKGDPETTIRWVMWLDPDTARVLDLRWTTLRGDLAFCLAVDDGFRRVIGTIFSGF